MKELQRIAIAISQINKQQIYLTPEQQHYLMTVLRLKTKDQFIAMDGQGKWLLCSLSNQNNIAEIQEEIEIKNELNQQIILMMALPKGNGFDEVVRQTTELGVNSIIPIISDRTLLKPSQQKIDRWQRIAQESAEQSERQIIPQILTPISFNESLKLVNSSHKYICVTRGENPHLLNCLPTEINENISEPMIILIGCEGGWTETEEKQAIAEGFKPVSLGNRIFRAVTAPIVALSMIVGIIESK
jgi:16S rRNA (uracil1498-N3)-methyltransferase